MLTATSVRCMLQGSSSSVPIAGLRDLRDFYPPSSLRLASVGSCDDIAWVTGTESFSGCSGTDPDSPALCGRGHRPMSRLARVGSASNSRPVCRRKLSTVSYRLHVRRSVFSLHLLSESFQPTAHRRVEHPCSVFRNILRHHRNILYNQRCAYLV